MNLKYPEELKEIHFITENMNFKIAIYVCNDFEKQQVLYLENNMDKSFTSLTVCQWCKNHNIKYQIVYPLSWLSVVRNPYKYFKFIQMKRELN